MCTKDRLVNFLDKNDFFFRKQYGSQATLPATVHIIVDIQNQLDCNKLAAGVFIDLRKVFDTIHHTILLRKLQRAAIMGIVYDWFFSYLTNRYQYGTRNSVCSSTELLENGVPQGSALGPIYLIYVIDIYFVNLLRQPYLFIIFYFADEVQTLLQKIKFDLDLISAWFITNKLTINTDNTVNIIFSKQDDNDVIDHLQLSGESLKLLKEMEISWSNH